MKKILLKQCPICQAREAETIYSLTCGNLDKSMLYPTVRITLCLRCGHIFNEITADELAGLANYYNDEYAPANLGVTDKTGDLPGSAGRLTTQRYDQLYRALSPHINPRYDVLDVGCALGGFLDYMSDKGFSKLTGVDMTQTYVEQARLKNRYGVEIGDAECLPFDDRTFDVIVMEQVLEHLSSPIKAFKEAHRVLKKDGIFCVGVPDAARYADYYFFDFYWFLLREHIQHFDISHLALLGKQTGFDLIDDQETVHAIMSERMIMPNVYAVFHLADSINQTGKADFDNFKLKRLTSIYFQQEEAKQSIKCQTIADLIRSQRPIFAWGIGREFLYLYESAGLKRCHIAGLIDANPFKQQVCTVGGMKIAGARETLPAAGEDSVLLITAVAHTTVIKLAAEELGFKGKVIDFTSPDQYALSRY